MRKNTELKLPDKIRICGIDVAVVYPIELSEGLAGLFDPDLPAIKLSGECSNNKRLLSCFLHEIMHAVDRAYLENYLIENIREEGIKLLETAFFSVLVQNTDALFTTKTPRNLSIFGYTVDITEKEFDDTCDNLDFRVCIPKEIIQLDKNTKNKFITSQNLISSILVGIVEQLHIDLDMNSVVIFGRGLYQVFVDNNLTKLFKEVK